MSIEPDSLAAIELERHRPQMLYAERQMLKAGQHEALAQSLVKRSRIHLIVGSVATVALFTSGRSFQILWAAVILGGLVLDWSHARRTLETIQRLGSAGKPNSDQGP